MSTIQAAPRWHSTEAVADLFDLSPRHVRRMIAIGELRAVQFGRVYRVSDEAIRDFAETHSTHQRQQEAA